MLKVVFLLLIAWFVITRLLRFKVVVYKNGPQPSGFQRPQRPEGKITIEPKPEKNKGGKDANMGDYIEYEEV